MEKKFWEYGELRVCENGRYLKNGDRPFFWMGDTAWLLFQKCSLPDAALYLRNRKEKRFSVIQATLVHCLGGNAVVYFDPARPSYWEHCDRIISLAEELGLYMALLPCWGSFLREGALTVETALRYADFLAARYRDRPNIIWLLGGDVRGSEGKEVYHAFGMRMRELFPHHRIGFHPFGRTSSSLWFHQEEWLDFNMFQSGHRRYDQIRLSSWDDLFPAEMSYGEDNWRYVRRDAALLPPKPTVDGEPSYEWIVQGLHDLTQPCWRAADVRRYAYWSVLEGAMGHTYGHNAIIQFYRKDQGAGSYGVQHPWTDAIHHEGSGQMGHLVSLMTSVDFSRGRPAGERLTWGQREQYHRISVFEGPDHLICYDYSGDAFALELTFLSGKAVEARWMDPANGCYSYLGPVFPEWETVFRPVRKYSDGSDWVLLLRF